MFKTAGIVVTSRLITFSHFLNDFSTALLLCCDFKLPCLWVLLPPKHFVVSAAPCLFLHNHISTLQHRMAKPDAKTNSQSKCKLVPTAFLWLSNTPGSISAMAQEGLKDTHAWSLKTTLLVLLSCLKMYVKATGPR